MGYTLDTMKILAKILFAIILLFVLFGVYLQYFVNLNDYKKQIQDRINSESDIKVSFDGELSWNVFPLFSIHLDKLSAVIDNKRVNATNVAIYPRLIPLLGREFNIRKMDANVFGGQITASFRTSLINSNKWYLRVFTDNLSGKELVKFVRQGTNFSNSGPIVSYLMSPGASLDGIVGFKMNMNSTGKGKDYLKQLNGNIRFNASNISYKLKSIPVSMAGNLLKDLTQPEKITSTLNYAGLILSRNIDKISFAASVKDGILSDDLIIRSGSLKVRGEGSVDLPANRIINSYNAYLDSGNGKKLLISECRGSLDNVQCNSNLTPNTNNVPVINKVVPKKLLKDLPF